MTHGDGYTACKFLQVGVLVLFEVENVVDFLLGDDQNMSGGYGVDV